MIQKSLKLLSKWLESASVNRSTFSMNDCIQKQFKHMNNETIEELMFAILAQLHKSCEHTTLLSTGKNFLSIIR